MISPRRIIFYLMDGVSATKLTSFNNQRWNEAKNANVQANYVDELSKQSHVFKYCYGFDTTQGSMYSIFSGQSHHETPISATQDCKLLRIRHSIMKILKDKGYKTHTFTNLYTRNMSLPLDDFDRFEFEPFKYDFSESKLDNHFWGINNNEKLFLFIHDMYTHDQNGLYVTKKKLTLTTAEYEKLINDHSKLVEKNLEFLKFDPEQDLLVFFSDHGMTLDTSYIPKGSAIFDKERINFWSYAGKEIKSRVFFMVRNNHIKPFVDENVCTLTDAVDYVMKLLDIQDFLSEDYKKLNAPKSAITNCAGIFPMNFLQILKRRFYDDRFYLFTYITGSGNNREKWIYQTNLNMGGYYNLNTDFLEGNPQKISFNELPTRMKEYLKLYSKTRRPGLSLFVSKGKGWYFDRRYRKLQSKLKDAEDLQNVESK